MFKLIIQDDEGKTTVVPLIRDEITIGRKEGNTIRLTERNVSRRHARIVKANGSIVVEDLDSYNGVKVNGARIQGRVPVSESDRIQIGDYLLELKLDRGAQVDPYQSQPGQTVAMGALDMLAGAQPGMAATGMPAPAPGPGNGSVATQHTAVVHLGNLARQNKPTTPMTPAAISGGYAPVPEAVAQQPTNPLAVPGPPGRLVVVSTNFGGREFLLDRPAMVIGRTDDNDIVINHRSISRNHAKILQEGNRYTIVDLDSSNGVRVNGEEYKKVELRRGDLVDLGHVKLRYVEPGEDFVFDRDATLVDVTARPPKRNKALVVAISSLVAIGGVIGIILAMKGGGPAPQVFKPGVPGIVADRSSKPPTPAATPGSSSSSGAPPGPVAPSLVPVAVASNSEPNATGPGDPTAANPTEPSAAVKPVTATPGDNPPPAPVPTNPPTNPSPVKPDVGQVLADGNRAFTEERWADSVAAAEQALRLDSGNPDARKLLEASRIEIQVKTSYDKFVELRDAGKVPEAARVYRDELARAKSRHYHDKATPSYEKMHDGWIHDREQEARTLRDKAKCEQVTTLARRSGEVFPEARSAVERAGTPCLPVAGGSAENKSAENKSPEARNPSTKPPEPKAPPESKEIRPGLSDDELQALRVSAKDAAKNSNWVEARKKADEVLRAKGGGGDIEMLTVSALSSCNLHDAGRAVSTASRLKSQTQRLITLKQLCAQQGITIP
jgi:pSer/pThr/pTyr-binding forkhead associated (FHA) protein